MSYIGKAPSGYIYKTISANKARWELFSPEIVVNSSTGNYSMASTNTNSLINHTADGTATYQLPTAAVGLVFHFIHNSNTSTAYQTHEVRIQPNTNDRIVFGQQIADNPGYFSLNKKGTEVTLVAIDSTTWQVVGYNFSQYDRSVTINDTQSDFSVFGRDLWVSKSAAPTNKRHCAEFPAYDYYYVVGGEGASTFSENVQYNGISDTWTAKTSAGTAASQLPGFSLHANGYKCGGDNSASARIATVERYNVLANSWSAVTSLPLALRRGTTGVLNGFGYYINGENSTPTRVSTVYKYNDNANTWTAVASTSTASEYSSNFQAVGFSYWMCGAAPGVIATTQRYDDSANTWTTMDSVTTARTEGAGASKNDFGYMCGGFTGADVGTTDEFNFFTSLWTTKSSMLVGRRDHEAGNILGYVYISHGFTGAVTNTTEEYN